MNRNCQKKSHKRHMLLYLNVNDLISSSGIDSADFIVGSAQ